MSRLQARPGLVKCARKITGHALRICHDVVKFVSNFSRERVSLISEARRLWRAAIRKASNEAQKPGLERSRSRILRRNSKRIMRP